jgi:hypothetical protein
MVVGYVQYVQYVDDVDEDDDYGEDNHLSNMNSHQDLNPIHIVLFDPLQNSFSLELVHDHNNHPVD